MLSKEELVEIAEHKNITLKNAEKDYLQDMLLFNLYKLFGRKLIFKGGTCLYKVYGLNRFSEDLDFNLVKHFKVKNILEKCLYSMKTYGVSGRIKFIDEYQKTINIGLEFFGPRYDGSKQSMCFLSLDMSLRKKPILEPRPELVFPKSKDIPSFELFAMDEKEILAEKISAVYSRNKARDVYDLWFLTKKAVEIDTELIQKKLKNCKLLFSYSELFKKINEKERIWEPELKDFIIGSLPDFKQVRNYLADHLKVLTPV